jgi:hypothetical protein
MNIDWEAISAKDLYILFSSFISGKEKVKKVTIYPSEFGMKEIERLKAHGPNELFEKSSDEFSDIEEGEKGEKNKNKNTKKPKSKSTINETVNNLDEIMQEETGEDGINQSKLRKFELKKLKYYYSIAEFDSKETANKIYLQCDGMEIEKTQNFLDLRFVPDELREFPYKPKEKFSQDEAIVDYEPDFNQNRALQHSKVKLTWDTNDRKREKMLERAFTKEGFNRDDINELLMSSESEQDEELMGFRQNLFNNDKDENGNGDMNLLKRKKNKEINIKEGEIFEVNFNKGFEGMNATDKIQNSSKNDKSNYKEYLERKKNIRREKKIEERKQKEFKKGKRNTDEFENNDNNTKRNYEDENENKLKKSNKKELSLLVDESLRDKKFKFNPSDNRFKAVGKDSKYAVDPTSKEYKNTKGKK